ncbi:DUF2147 domain-containing protein [Asticcacaulis sp. EMRT-3]|uniref:DUF2147 domain-containing protein n=1 Tax=Asticcacaulis sp. EMRT-3 TaxID=3040349 RepID=UPI0024AEF470|nr:DUF2147 domain-containing protein [Asticcacaulis sp. EMRT-3]MDI7775649.1 DUF2147 domain-containing protein [Asticcacaulis sp. EMRT-3]
MLPKTVFAAAALLLWAGPALAAQPIEGNWKTLKGDTARIAPCGDSFCITLMDGKYAGKQIGILKGQGGLYTGQVTDPEADKTYEGSATVTGNALKLQGCVMKIFCKSQVWTREQAPG